MLFLSRCCSTQLIADSEPNLMPFKSRRAISVTKSFVFCACAHTGKLTSRPTNQTTKGQHKIIFNNGVYPKPRKHHCRSCPRRSRRPNPHLPPTRRKVPSRRRRLLAVRRRHLLRNLQVPKSLPSASLGSRAMVHGEESCGNSPLQMKTVSPSISFVVSQPNMLTCPTLLKSSCRSRSA